MANCIHNSTLHPLVLVSTSPKRQRSHKTMFETESLPGLFRKSPRATTPPFFFRSELSPTDLHTAGSARRRGEICCSNQKAPRTVYRNMVIWCILASSWSNRRGHHDSARGLVTTRCVVGTWQLDYHKLATKASWTSVPRPSGVFLLFTAA